MISAAAAKASGNSGENPVRARRLWALPAQNDHRQHRRGVENPARKNDVSIELLKGAAGRQHDGPDPLDQQGNVRGFKTRVNFVPRRKT